MKPYQDSTLISLVLACCEDPTHPIEPLSDWIQEQGHNPPDPDYTDPNWEFWYEVLERKAYRAGCENRTWHQLLGQLRDLGTWEEMG